MSKPRYIITNNQPFFEKIGDFNYCNLEDMDLETTLAVDTETTNLSSILGDMFAIQIADNKAIYLIDMQTHNHGIKFEKVIPYLEDKTLIFHNATFDLGFFYKHNFFPTKIQDTFVMSKILYNGKPPWEIKHSFGECMQREMNLYYDKSEQKNINVTQLRTSKSIEYCFNDVDRLIDLAKTMYIKLKKAGSLEAYKIHAQYTRVLAYMEQCGLPIDEGRWREKMDKDKIELDKATGIIVEYIYNNLPKFRDLQVNMFSEDIKILPKLSSQKQMIPVFEALGINVVNDEGKNSIKEDVISKSSHEFIKIWLDYQGAQHDVTTYGKNVLDKVVEGRIYTTYNIILDTARISTRKSGINFLNFPANEKTRRCFKAKKGFKMIGCDYAGQETRVLGDKSQDISTIDSIINNKDLHCAFARVLFPEIKDLSDKEIKKTHSDKRKAAKAPRFLFSYGGNGYTLHVNENIPLEEALEIEKAFRELHEGVYEWGKEVLHEAIKRGYIESAAGFKLYLPYYEEFCSLKNKVQGYSKEFWMAYKEGKTQQQVIQELLDTEGDTNTDFLINNRDSYNLYHRTKGDISKFFKSKSNYQKLCLNNPIQTTSAFQTKSALIRLFDYIVEHGDIWKCKIVVAPHDEIDLECVEEKAEEYKGVLETCMIEEGNKFIEDKRINMDCDAAIGESWNDVHM